MVTPPMSDSHKRAQHTILSKASHLTEWGTKVTALSMLKYPHVHLPKYDQLT